MFPSLDPEMAGMVFGPMLADDALRGEIENTIRQWLSDRNLLEMVIWTAAPNDPASTGFVFDADEIPRLAIAFAAATFGFSVPGYELPAIFQSVARR